MDRSNTERYRHIKQQDKAVFDIMVGEEVRQHEGLELIPSENYVSEAVREALASSFTNKYSEGYPGKRYYGGQEWTDQVEQLAIDRAKELFDCGYANVQPLSGAPANLAVYSALLKPGETVLGMSLEHGGHLTHGHPVTHPAKIYNFIRYGIADTTTGAIDYEEMRALAHEHRPKIVLAGFSAYSRELDYQKIVDIAREVDAIAMIDAAHIAGLIAGRALQNPLQLPGGDGFDVMTLTTHKSLRGPRGGMILTRNSAEIAKKIDKSVFPGLQGGPHMNNVAAKAVAFGEALTKNFRDYARQIIDNAQAMAAVFDDEGIQIVNGGTDNHLLLVDVTQGSDNNKAFSSEINGGKAAQQQLDEIGITLNMNVIPNDRKTALDPSGIRFGTPAITTRGMTAEQCREIAATMIGYLRDTTDTHRQAAKSRITDLAKRFPVPKTFV
jgi:glycine hydroxymethyltransferase